MKNNCYVDPVEKLMQEERKALERKERWTLIGWCSLLALLLIVVILVVFWEIYVWVKYGGKPVTDIPAWALWFMFKNGGK